MDLLSTLSGLPENPSGVHCMTTRELCNHDDIATSIIIDPMIGFKTHKMNLRYRAPSAKDKKALKSATVKFLTEQNREAAFSRFLSVNYVRRYVKKLSLEERINFRDHLLRFFAVFSQESGFTIQPCTRYKAEKNLGAMLVVTKPWTKGTVIKNLVGVIGNLTLQEENKLLKKNHNDFSVMYSLRKQRAQLWLGPGAYINHDCQPSCKFVPRGSTAHIEVIRDMLPSDEVTCYYGSDFFGDDNEVCECLTCEKLGKGAFRGRSSPETMDLNSTSSLQYSSSRYPLRETVSRQVNYKSACKNRSSSVISGENFDPKASTTEKRVSRKNLPSQKRIHEYFGSISSHSRSGPKKCRMDIEKVSSWIEKTVDSNAVRSRRDNSHRSCFLNANVKAVLVRNSNIIPEVQDEDFEWKNPPIDALMQIEEVNSCKLVTIESNNENVCDC